MTPYLPDGVSQALYPFTGKFIALKSGVKMHYLDEGKGKPVVMLHGNPSWSFYYRNLALAMRENHRVIAPDHIGCGLSDKPGDDRYEYTLKNRVDDIEFLLDSLGVKEKITLVVHDWGGMIGMAYAVRRPERIEKLIILNTGAFFLPDGKAFPPALRLCRTPLGAALIRGFNAFARGAAWVGCKRRRMNRELRRAYAAPYNSWANRIATLRFVEDIPLLPGDKAYPIVRETQKKLNSLSALPMLICWGMKDFVFDRHFLEEWKHRFPGAEIHTFPDCGHYILEDAQEEIIPLIKNFIGRPMAIGPDTAPTQVLKMPDLKDISSLISELAAAMPDRPAVIDGARTISFRDLDSEISLLAAGLSQAGIKPGLRAALMVPPSIEFVTLTFALFRAGAVIVLIDPGIGPANMRACLEESRPEAFIGVPKAHAARLALRWAKKSLRIFITVGKKWLWGGFTLEDIKRLGSGAAPPAPESAPETAAILFTSGSTGVPKGAVYTHSMFAAQARMLKEYFKIEPGFCSVPTFPLFALFDVALGLTIVIPEMDFTRPTAVNPSMLAGLISKYNAVQLFGSPALLDTLSRYGEKRGTLLPSLKRVISCGAPVSHAIIGRIKKMLAPETQIFTPYGATEALPVSCISSGELAVLKPDSPGICVGRTWEGMETFIIKISDAPISSWSDDLLVKNGEIGEITVKGPVVSGEYFGRKESTALAKIRGTGGELYHRMGDTGWKDADGRLWFCGRKSHRVTTPAGTLFTIPCETVFNAHPDVRRTALIGAGPAGRQTPALCVELEEGFPERESLRSELLALGAANEQTKNIKTILYHPGFPVDIRHNAKISREKLAAWAEERLTSGAAKA